MRTDASDIVENEHVDPEQDAEKEQAALRAETRASLTKQAAVSKKQAALREDAAAEEQQKIAEEALEHQAEIEAETRVEEGTAALLKSQVETVINKDVMIDVISCTRGSRLQWSCYPLECTRLPGETHRSLRKDACTGTWHPARVQWHNPRAGQSGFHHRDHAGRSQRGVQQIGAPMLAPQGRRTDCRRAQLWSETEKRGHLLTELGSLRDQRAQIAETVNMKNMEGKKTEGVPNAGSRGSRKNPKA